MYPEPFFQATWQILLELAPWLIFGTVFAGAMHAFLPSGMMSRWLGGSGAVWKSVLVGIPLPLCSCAVIPVGLGLKRQGASDGASVAFLIATPQTGVDSVLVTAGMLGWPLALFKVATAMVTGLVGGWLTDATTPKQFSLPVIENSGSQERSATFADRLRSGAAHADELIRSIWRWLVIGVLISAAITTLIPPAWMEGLAACGLMAAMGAALALSLPLYVCATASVPIAASLVAAGLPLGAVIVFLMAGPATNVATLGAVYRGLGTRALAAYLTTIVLGAVAGALLFEAWLGGSVAPSAIGHAGHAHAHAARWWEVASAALLLVWIAGCLYRDMAKRFAPSASEEATDCCH